MLNKISAAMSAAVLLWAGLNPLPASAVYRNTYDAVVNAIQCGPDTSTEWFRLNFTQSSGHTLGITLGHNVLPGSTDPRNEPNTWVVRATNNGNNQSSGYRITIVRISAGPRGRTQGFKDITIYFRRQRFRGIPDKLSNFSVRATPQDSSIPAKVLRFDQMRIRSLQGTAWEIAEANNDDFGISNTTFVRTFDVLNTASFGNIELGRFNVRSHFADILDRCTINFDSVRCD